MSEILTREERNARVQAALGDGRVICEDCGATLETMGDECGAPIAAVCPGFEAIEMAIYGHLENIGK